MSDLADDFRAIAAYSKQKRASNRERSTAELAQRGIAFESKNHGTHLIVGEHDFWPGTGLWSHRKSGSKGRGVFNLIRAMETTQ